MLIEIRLKPSFALERPQKGREKRNTAQGTGARETYTWRIERAFV